MNQSNVFASQFTQQKYYNDNNLNFSDFTKMWFFIPYDRWFLSKDEKEPMVGSGGWFDSATRIIRAINKTGRKNKIDGSKVKIQISKDPELLQQFYNLREGSYRKEWNFAEYSGGANEYDKKGEIILAVYEGRVVGGARIGFSEYGYLSNEEPDKNFTYKEICNAMSLETAGVKYTELSSVVLAKEFRNNLLGRLYEFAIEISRMRGAKYIFGISTYQCNREYRMILKKMGVNSLVTNKIPAPKKPEYNNIDMFPIVVLI